MVKCSLTPLELKVSEIYARLLIVQDEFNQRSNAGLFGRKTNRLAERLLRLEKAYFYLRSGLSMDSRLFSGETVH